MKKLLLCFTLAAVAAVTGCKEGPVNIDRVCYWDFVIKNDTDSNIIVEVSESLDYRPGQTITSLSPGSKETVYIFEGESPRYGLIGDGFPYPDYVLLNFSWLNKTITIDGGFVPDAIWTRKYWEFTDGELHAIYTLTITDKLVESLKNSPQGT